MHTGVANILPLHCITNRAIPSGLRTLQRWGNAMSLVIAVWAVRYQVKDVIRSVAFYTERLGFKLDQQTLSGPGSSGE